MVSVMSENYVLINRQLEEAKLNDYLKNNTIYLDCEVDRDSSVWFCRQLTRLAERELRKEEKDRKNIKVMINSYGGCVVDFFYIASTILRYEEKGIIIETYCNGYAMSAGAYILMLGTKGHRYATRFCNIMVHQTQLTLCNNYTQADLKRLNEDIEKNWDILVEIMKKYTNMTDEDIAKLTDKNLDVTYHSKEALEKGIIDKII